MLERWLHNRHSFHELHSSLVDVVVVVVAVVAGHDAHVGIAAAAEWQRPWLMQHFASEEKLELILVPGRHWPTKLPLRSSMKTHWNYSNSVVVHPCIEWAVD